MEKNRRQEPMSPVVFFKEEIWFIPKNVVFLQRQDVNATRFHQKPIKNSFE